MIHVYHGEGKGKTTASMGLALRATANGKRVMVCQFMKDGSSGEISLLRELAGVSVLHDEPPVKFSFRMTDDERAAARAQHDRNLAACIAAMETGEADLIVLDEALGALSCDLLDPGLINKALDLAAGKAKGPELVLTGRNPPQFVLDAADYITQMTCERHPFAQGVRARRGIEF